MYNILNYITNDNEIIVFANIRSNKRYCEDCCRYNDNLVEVHACADYMGCCYKKICKDKCIFRCSECYEEFEDVENGGKSKDNDGNLYLYCEKCVNKDKYSYDRIITWYGISEYEYHLRYD